MAGVHLQILMGSVIAVPVPSEVAEALVSAEITHQEAGRSGFQLTFHVGRSGTTHLTDFNFLQNPLFRPFNRVILIVTLNATPRVLFDGVITHHAFSPSPQPGASTLTLTGEDVSLMMDMQEFPNFYPAADDGMIAAIIIAKYAQYGLIPIVVPPVVVDPTLPTDMTPCKVGTDLSILTTLARKHAYVFYVIPGTTAHTNFAYWGPPVRDPKPQRALSYNLGADTNVDSLGFQYNALEPTLIAGLVQDRQLNETLPVVTFQSTRPQLSRHPALLSQAPNVRIRLVEQTQGATYLSAFWQAQSTTNASVESVITGSGELNAARYGDVLQARGIVPVRGVGYTYDGLYYVKSVSHSISRGEWKQSFSLTREGLGTTIQSVHL